MEINSQLLWTPDHNTADMDTEIDDMLERAYFTQAWIDGRVETDVFADYLAEKGICPKQFAEQLEYGAIVV